MSNLTPTQEQQAIIDAAISGENLAVNSCAGSGKTSTIKMLANAMSDKTGIYLAFNKSIATEMNEDLPSNVIAKTTHSVAYGEIIIKGGYQRKITRPKGGYVNVAGTPAEIEKFYNIQTEHGVQGIEVARLVKSTVTNFEQSADWSVSKRNVPKYLVKEIIQRAAQRTEGHAMDETSLIDQVVLLAKKLWLDRNDKNSPVIMTHDTYLKMYQLSKPVLNYDVIYLDEAADSNHCVLDIVTRQKAQVIMVGDSKQAIYQWRGSIDAMRHAGYKTLFLSQSWRWGQAVADVANKILEGTTDMVIRGNPSLETTIGTIDTKKPYTVIFRTNAALIERALMLLAEGVQVEITIDVKDFEKKLEQCIALYRGDYKKVKHEELVGFKSWDELVIEAQEAKGELLRLARMVANGKAQQMLRIIQNYRKPVDPHVTLVTAHKSKGLQWDQVELANDFQTVEPEMERNLLYVAATRAKKCMQINQLVMKILNDEALNDGEEKDE